MTADPDVLSVPEAARVIGCTPRTLRAALAENEQLHAAIVIDFPGTHVRISRPRLLRHLHGDEWQAVAATVAAATTGDIESEAS